MVETEILVVGGGPAGAIAAKYLALSGLDTLLVQRNLSFKKPCGGGIRLDAFDEFNIDRKIIQKQVNTIALVYKESRVEVDISNTPLAIVERVSFDAQLRDDAQAAGAVIKEATFISMEFFDDHVISILSENGEYKKIYSKFVIAADGVNSKIRKLINGDRVSCRMTRYADLRSKEYKACEFHFGGNIAGQHYAWAFPHFQGGNVGTLAGENKGNIDRFLKSLEIDEDLKSFGYKIPDFKNNIFYKNRVFFVGDSASQVLPFTYEGIYYAMSSAKILAEVLIENKEPQEYEKMWNQKYLKRFATLRTLQIIFLKNDFMISLMMRLFKNRYIQKQAVLYWLGQRDLTLNFNFFLRLVKKVF